MRLNRIVTCIYRKYTSGPSISRNISLAQESYVKAPSLGAGIFAISVGVFCFELGRLYTNSFSLASVDIDSELAPSIKERKLSKSNNMPSSWKDFISKFLGYGHLTKETVRGSCLIEAEYVGNNTKLLFLGSNLCGHKGIVHGGFIATILQEACREFTGNDISTKATFSVNYIAPVHAEQCVTISASEPFNSPQGLTIKAKLLDNKGSLLSTITAIFPSN